MSENVTTEPDGASNSELAELTDFELDRKIVESNQMIKSAIEGRDRAVDMIKACEKSAVLSAWRLGKSLIEKKTRLTHGSWLPWLDSCGISPSSASDYTRIARQIASAGDLGSSIRETLLTLPAPATAKPKSKPTLAVRIVEPTTAKPKSKPTLAVRIVEPATAKPKSKPTLAVRIVEPEPVWPTALDSAAMIEGLEKELYDEREKNETLEERTAIMEEAVDPKSRKAIDKLNNQAELIRTLKASVAKWQSKHADARRENGALKRRIRALENQKGARAI